MDLRQGDCLEIMPDIPDGSIDLTVTSPPYDNLRTYNDKLVWNWDVFTGIADHLFRVTKQGGVVVWVVGDATINGSETGTSFKQALYFKDIGFNLHDTMIYGKSSQPRQNGYRYEQQFEYMFVFCNGTTKIKNPITEKSKNGGLKVIRTCRDSGKDRLKKTTNTVAMEKVKSNIWVYGTKKNEFNHPAIFPEKLAHDHIISWSNEGDTVLDPMMGSGTTGKMAMMLNRDFIGIEKDPEYFKIAKTRIKNAMPLFNA